MRLHLIPILTFLLSVIGIVGCGPVRRTDKSDSSIQISPDSVVPVMERATLWADSVMRGMSLQLRVGQLFMPAVFTSSDDATMERISDYADRLGVGGIILLKGNVESAASIADSISRLSPCPLFIAVDAETGLSMRFEDAPDFLWNSQISNDADSVALSEYGMELARECQLMGINMILGPVLDVVSDNSYGFKGAEISRLRSFGKNARRVASLGVSYAGGLENGGVISVAKHFPGHGAASADSHRLLAVVDRSREELDSIDLLPFRKYVEAGLSAVMVGHIYNMALDSVKRPATFSPLIITELLRKEMGFSGLILTDAINMMGAEGYSAVDAFKAGADIVLAPQNTEKEIADVVEAAESGSLDKGIIDDRCRRILIYKYLKGLVDSERPARFGPNLHRELDKGAASVKSRLINQDP